MLVRAFVVAALAILHGSDSAAARKLTGRFLHITDIHPDPFYRANSSVSAACHHNRPHDDPERAGWLGTPVSECDTPPALVDYTFDWLERNWKHDVDFVIWTGDNARHDIDTSYPRSIDEIYDLNRQLIHRFEKLFEDRGIPVVPSLGNNDIYPHNIIRPGPNAITAQFAKLWSSFVPPEEYHTVARGVYFSREVIPDQLVVVSLNTMYFFDNNKVVDGCPPTKSGDTADPGTLQLDWLLVQLGQWRQRGLQVWLTGHVPPTQANWYAGCLDKYTELTVAFQDTIVGQMFGHVNVDTFAYLDWSDLDNGRQKKKSKRKIHKKDLFSIQKFTHNALFDAYSALPARRKMKIQDYAIVHTGPSVIPTYLPSVRVWNYNVTNADDAYVPRVSIEELRETDTTFNIYRKRIEGLLAYAWDSSAVSWLRQAGDLDVLRRRRKGRKHRKKKKRPIPRIPRNHSPESPSRMNRYLTPLGYTQYYLPIDKFYQPNWTIEYVTYPPKAMERFLPSHMQEKELSDTQTPYGLKDLTVYSWLNLAKELTASKKMWKGYVRRMYVSSGAED